MLSLRPLTDSPRHFVTNIDHHPHWTLVISSRKNTAQADRENQTIALLSTRVTMIRVMMDRQAHHLPFKNRIETKKFQVIFLIMSPIG